MQIREEFGHYFYSLYQTCNDVLVLDQAIDLLNKLS